MNTWGISGTHFLVIYGAILALTGALVFVIRRRITGESDRSGLARLRAPELTPYEVAMLKGGDSLALTVAACRLKEAGSLALGESGGLEAPGPLVAQPDSLEKWVHATVRESPGSSQAVLDTRAAEPALAPIRQRLSALGLLLEPRQRSLIRWQLCWFVPVFVLGVARLIAGSQNHRPIGFLVVLMLAGAYGAYELTKPPLATLAGGRLLKQLEQDSSVFSSYGFAGDVALSGLAALWAADATLATVLGLKHGVGGFGSGGCGGGGGCAGGCGG